jgi:purine-cytosine permease-like protein
MFTWSKNNRACTTTWSTLVVLDQIKDVFNDSGTLKICDFTFWNRAASSNMKRLMASTLAIQMDNVFTMIRGAKYEDGITKDKAISDIVDILVNGDKTVLDLAEVNDNNYLFWQEVK